MTVKRQTAKPNPLEAPPTDGPYFNTGLTTRTAKALIGHGIDTPERLLSITERRLSLIPGIGPVSMMEIMRYRGRFGKNSG